MSNATPERLREALLDALLARIESGEAEAKDFQAAIAYLKTFAKSDDLPVSERTSAAIEQIKRTIPFPTKR